MTPDARLRKARLKHGLSQAQVATALKVTRSAVSQWERFSGVNPNSNNLRALADLLKVNYEWLATGRGTMAHGDTHDEPPAVMKEFAFDEQESRLLGAYRLLSARKKSAVLDLVERIKN